MSDAQCVNCGYMPARMMLPDTQRRICGVCAHRLRILKRVAKR